MPFSNTNAFITGNKPMPTPAGAEIIACRMAIDLATGDLALNDIGQIGWLPAGCVPVDLQVDGTDMDSSTAAVVFTVGLLNAAKDAISTDAADGGGAWAATTASATAFIQRPTPTLNNMAKVTAASVDRAVGVLVSTAPTTAVAGTLGVTLFYRAA